MTGGNRYLSDARRRQCCLYRWDRDAQTRSVWRLPIGSTRPLHNAATSRAVLAFLSDAEIEDYIHRNQPMDLTPSAAGTISPENVMGRDRGYQKKTATPSPIAIRRQSKSVWLFRFGMLMGRFMARWPSEAQRSVLPINQRNSFRSLER